MLFEKYIERALQRRGSNRYYAPERTKRWLAWLAQELAQQNQTGFYLERMQPDWLSGQRERRQYCDLVVRLIYAVPVVITVVLVAGLLGLFGGDNAIFGWMTPRTGDSFDGAETFSMLFCILATLTFLQVAASPNATQQCFWKTVSKGLLIGIVGTILIGILFCFLFFAISDNVRYSLNHGLDFGLSSGLTVGLLGAFILGEHPRSEQAMRRKTLRTRYARMADGLVLGLCGWGSFAVVISATISLQEGLLYGAIVGCTICILFGLAWGTCLLC